MKMKTTTAVLITVLVMLVLSGGGFWLLSKIHQQEIDEMVNELNERTNMVSEIETNKDFQCSKYALLSANTSENISDPKKVIEKFYSWLQSRVITTNPDLSQYGKEGMTDRQKIGLLMQDCYNEGGYFGFPYSEKNFLNEITKRFTASSITSWQSEEDKVFFCLDEPTKLAGPVDIKTTEPIIENNRAKLTATLTWQNDAGTEKTTKKIQFEMEKFADEQIVSPGGYTWLIKEISCL